MLRRTFEGGQPEAYLAFDGGYNNGLSVGTWAVVLIYKDSEILLEYGHAYNSNSSDLEFIAAENALRYAKSLGIETLAGDYEGCIKSMNKKNPDFVWTWIPSKSNPADKYTKYYP